MSDLPAEIKVWFSRYPIDYMGTWATTRYPAEAVTYVPKADAEAAVALALEEAADLHAKLWRETSAYKESQIRALAPPAGVAKLAELRAERDEAVSTLAYCEKQWTDTDRITHAKMLDERARADTLAAELAASRAREAGLRDALTPSGDTKAAYMGEVKDPETKRMVSWTAIKMVMAMISARAALAQAPAPTEEG